MNPTDFPSRTDVGKLLLTGASLLLLPAVLLVFPFLSSGPFLYGLVAFWGFCAVATLLPFVHTVYRIENGRLMYRSGLRWGSVPIDRIWRVTREATTRGVNASVSYTGLRIRFFTGEVFIAPKHQAAFIAALQRINPAIIVRDARK